MPDDKQKPETQLSERPHLCLVWLTHYPQADLNFFGRGILHVQTELYRSFFIGCWLFFVLISKVKVRFIIVLNIVFYIKFLFFFVILYFFVYFRTIVLIALFSQYLSNIKIPLPGYSKNKGGCYVGRYPFFRLFPVSIVEDNF